MTNFDKKPTEEMVPNLYKYAETLEMAGETQFASDTLYVVAFEATDPASTSGGAKGSGTAGLKLVSTVEAGWDGKLNDAVAKMKLKAIKMGRIVVVDGISFVFTAVSPIASTWVQKSRQIGLDAGPAILESGISKLGVCGNDSLSACDMIEGLINGLYFSDSFKQNQETISYDKTIKVMGPKPSDSQWQASKAMIEATLLTRFMEDAPSNWFNSERFAELGQWIGKKLNVKVNVRGRKELAELGMGSFLAVAQGTHIDPKMITIEIDGEDNSKTVCLIGKGLTFDAGGVSLKPSLGMGEMKYDMCGGASVMGAAYYLGKVKPKHKTICMIGAVENVMSSHSVKPGDIVTASNGKTIEILNTDAEGRLVLADLLAYCHKNYKPELMVNVATLTGAVLVALGSVGCAIMGNHQSRVETMKKIGEKVGEPSWQLPLWPEFEKEVKSEFADLKNIANPDVKAGTVMAGMFLKEFVGDTPWVHMDIAGTGWTCKALGHPAKGGSAFGVRTLSAAASAEL